MEIEIPELFPYQQSDVVDDSAREPSQIKCRNEAMNAL